MSLVLYVVMVGLIFSAGWMGCVAWADWSRHGSGHWQAWEDAGASLVLLACGLAILRIFSL